MPIRQGVSKTKEPEKAVDTVRHETKPTEDAIQILEGPEAMSYARDLAFMAEPVEVMVQPSHDRSDTTRLVDITINGKHHFLLRGEWATVPRYVLEVLAKAKKEAWQFGYKKNSDGSTSDTDYMSRILRYPHQFKDLNPKGMAWYDTVKDSFL